jgi:hypothetical protein
MCDGAGPPDTKSLPSDDSRYIAICVAALADSQGIEGDFIAYWLADDPAGSAAGLVAIW